MTPADDRPRWARIVRVGVALELVGLASAWGWRWVVHGRPESTFWFPALCGLALVGVCRRVAWGRFLFSTVSMLMAALATVTLVPIPDDVFEGGSTLERMFGTLPPLALCWLIVIGSVTLILAPAVALGWRKRWFRSARW